VLEKLFLIISKNAILFRHLTTKAGLSFYMFFNKIRAKKRVLVQKNHNFLWNKNLYRRALFR